MLDQIEEHSSLVCASWGGKTSRISKPIEVYAIGLDKQVGTSAAPILAEAKLKQNIKYCRADDGVRLAYATVGSGPPLVRSAHWLGIWNMSGSCPYPVTCFSGSPEISPLYATTREGMVSPIGMLANSRLRRGKELETVVDAAGLERFPLFGFSGMRGVDSIRGSSSRVSHLVLYGGYGQGRMMRPEITDADRERDLR